MKAAVIALKSLSTELVTTLQPISVTLGEQTTTLLATLKQLDEFGQRPPAAVVLRRLRFSRFFSSRFSWPAAWRVTCSTTEVSMLTHSFFSLRCYVARSSAARAKRGRVRLANVSFGLNGRLSTKLTKTKSRCRNEDGGGLKENI